jgi:hypothetical protein
MHNQKVCGTLENEIRCTQKLQTPEIRGRYLPKSRTALLKMEGTDK